MHVYYDLEQLPAFQNAVITIGSFDGVHRGHQEILERLKTLAKRCSGESVVVTFHPHPRQVIYPKDKSLRLLTTIEEKTELLLQYGVDHVVVVPFTVDFSQISADEYIEKFLVGRFHPHTIVIGYDHRFGLNRQGDINFLRWYADKYQYKVVEIAQQTVDDIGISSTKIRRALEGGDLAGARKLLGYDYILRGTVVKGQQIGSQLGFPTANLRPSDRYKLIPADGIYAVHVHHQGQRYDGMLYIGERPTFPEHTNRTIEVNIFDFSADIYEHELQLTFIERLRGDASFTNIDDLRQQLMADRADAQAVLADYADTPPSPRQLTTAVVVLNYNGIDYLRQFLPLLREHTGRMAEIIVADNGSTDGSVPMLAAEFPDIRVLALPQNYGFAGGYNVALQQIDHDIYVLLNSDVAVTADWLTASLDLLAADATVAACQPKIRDFHRPAFFEYAGAAGGWLDYLAYPFCRGRIFHTLEEDRGQYDTAQEIFWATGAALFIRADLFHRGGGFDTTYFAHAEEIDLCWRLKRAGYKVMALPQATVYHMGGGTLHYDTPRKAYLNFRNTLITNFKNLPLSKLLWLLPARLLLDGVAGFLFLSQGKFRHILAILRAHGSFYRRLGYLSEARKWSRTCVEDIRIGPDRTHIGTYPGSIIWAYYALKIKQFSRLSWRRLREE